MSSLTDTVGPSINNSVLKRMSRSNRSRKRDSQISYTVVFYDERHVTKS